jgi:hypothetical protein
MARNCSKADSSSATMSAARTSGYSGLDVDVEAQPGLTVDHLDEPAELGGVLNAVLGLAEDDRHEARALPQLVKGR